jgi:hypothetical protein
MASGFMQNAIGHRSVVLRYFLRGRVGYELFPFLIRSRQEHSLPFRLIRRTFKAAVQKCNIFCNLLHYHLYQALQDK